MEQVATLLLRTFLLLPLWLLTGLGKGALALAQIIERWRDGIAADETDNAGADRP